MAKKRIKTPIGDMIAEVNGDFLVALDFVEEDSDSSDVPAQDLGHNFNENKQLEDNQLVEDPQLLEEKQLLEVISESLLLYFQGLLTQFDVPIKPKGTDYQKRVWQALQTIEYAETASYKDIATLVDNPKGSRSIGMANHKNPIAIVVPCHRVIGADGKLVGYAGGLWRKQWLIQHEKAHKVSTSETK